MCSLFTAVLLTEDDLQISKRDLVFQFETWKVSMTDFKIKAWQYVN